MSRVRALLIAESANPEWTSVPLVGWSHALAMREVADVHLVTHIRNQPAIERAGFREGEDFTAINSEAIDAPLYRLSSLMRGDVRNGWMTNTAMRSIGKYYFDHLVWRRFANVVRAGKYPIVHQITPLSPTSPSLIAARFRRAGAHFIWGPVNGGVPWPPGFDSVRKSEREWLAPLRNAYKFLPGYRGVRENAAALVLASATAWKEMPECYHDKCVYMPENGIDQNRFNDARVRGYALPLRVAYVGRLVPLKGCDMLIEALAPLLQSGRLTIEFFGDGPERIRLESMVEAAGLRASVIFHGNVEHKKLQEKLVLCDIFGFPSIREFGGGVVLEAMALGLVPVVVGYGGPNELVTDETGYRIPIGPRASIIKAFRSRFEELCNDPAPLAEKSSQSRIRIAKYYTWEAKARQMLEIYAWVLAGHRGLRPDFGICPMTGES